MINISSMYFRVIQRIDQKKHSLFTRQLDLLVRKHPTSFRKKKNQKLLRTNSLRAKTNLYI